MPMRKYKMAVYRLALHLLTMRLYTVLLLLLAEYGFCEHLRSIRVLHHSIKLTNICF